MEKLANPDQLPPHDVKVACFPADATAQLSHGCNTMRPTRSSLLSSRR
jgi:hypothetical protein